MISEALAKVQSFKANAPTWKEKAAGSNSA